MTEQGLKDQILDALGLYLGTFPVDDLVAEFIDTYGLVSVEDVPEDEFYDMAEKHDIF